jgi:NlpC/P60 family putative phage cell wall peptidase
MAVRQGLGRQNEVSKRQEWRNKVIHEARSWVGTPHRHYTICKGAGADCGLFIIGVYSKLGLIKEEKPDFYPEDWAWHKPVGEMFESIVQKYCVEIKKEEMQPGDLILYQFGKCLSHSSLLLEDDFIIHSEKPIGVTVSNRYSSQWYKREKKYYSYID